MKTTSGVESWKAVCTPIAPFVYRESPGNYVAAVSERGRLLLFAIAELKYQPRGRGMIVMGLEEGEKLHAVAISDEPRLIISGTAARSGKEKELVLEQSKLAHHILKRARMGRVLPEKLKLPISIRTAAQGPADGVGPA